MRVMFQRPWHVLQIGMSTTLIEPSSGPFLEPKAHHHAFGIPGWLRVARDHHEGGTFGVAHDIATLAFGPGKLKPYEYFFMGLYEGERIDAAERRRFMGERARVVLHKEAIASEWLAVTYDKLLFLLAMRDQGLPVPDVRATFHPGRNFVDVACLSDADAVARWLREDAAHPFFSKPVESTGSAGTASIDAYDAVTDELVSADARRVSVEQFSCEVGRYRERGYLFQERIVTHPEIAPICGMGVPVC